MKNYVVSGGYMRRIPINAMKNENFPVNSLFFKEFRSETGYRKTASTTTQSACSVQYVLDAHIHLFGLIFPQYGRTV